MIYFNNDYSEGCHEKVLEALGLDAELLEHLEKHLTDCEKEFDDDAESIITNQRYDFIKRLMDNSLALNEKRKGKATLSDRIGLMVARAVADATHPVSSLSPLERLSRDECVEPREVVRAVAVNVVALPILLAILAAFILPRKQEE